MKKWNCPTLTVLNSIMVNSLILANARSICERAFIR